MSTIMNASLTDFLPLSMPKLEANRINWVIFLIQFHDTIEAKGHLGNFDRTTLIPEPLLLDKPTVKETATKDQ